MLLLEALKRAKMEGLRFHDLRHTSATRMVESGASIVAVSKILGHAALKTTMRDRKSTRLNSSHIQKSRMPSSA